MKHAGREKKKTIKKFLKFGPPLCPPLKHMIRTVL